MNRLEQIVLSYRDDMVKTLQELVAIPSPQGPAEPGKPFGPGPYAALQYALNKARELGFEAVDVDGYAGHADLGQGDKTLGILVHLDVVPEGEGWTVPPYAGLVRDGKVWGRGSCDNKCSVVTSLYAMKAIREAGIPLKQRIRLILGCNEETDWADIDYYKTKYAMPDYGYLPDASFPCYNAEKGIHNVRLSAPFAPAEADIQVVRWTGGTALNVVPQHSTCLLRCVNGAAVVRKLADFSTQKGFPMSARQQDEGLVLIEAEGVPAHGSHPEAGKNALGMVALFLRDLGAGAGQCRLAIEMLANCLGMEGDGASLGVKMHDEPSGDLSCNLGILKMDENGFEAFLDIRQPVTISFETVQKAIQATVAPYGVTAATHATKAPLYLPKDHPMVQKFLQVYEDVTGQKGEALSMGGGTYARALNNAVAFGPSMPGSTGSGGAHEADEHCDIEEMMTAARIYVQALAALATE